MAENFLPFCRSLLDSGMFAEFCDLSVAASIISWLMILVCAAVFFLRIGARYPWEILDPPNLTTARREIMIPYLDIVV
jgi:hypothetical protein